MFAECLPYSFTLQFPCLALNCVYIWESGRDPDLSTTYGRITDAGLRCNKALTKRKPHETVTAEVLENERSKASVEPITNTNKAVYDETS